MISYVLNSNGVTVLVQGRPYNISKGHAIYSKVIDLIKAKKSEKDFFELIRVEQENQNKPKEFFFTNNQVFYGQERLDSFLENRMLEMQNEGFDLTAMKSFVINLMRNPSRTAVKELYAFLEKGSMPITPDGHFMAYKAVRADFKDIHSGTIDNSVGQVCQMNRKDVDDNRHNTCSKGLHFCSFDYLSNFVTADGHIMLVKINPADVVSIPSDYNETKGRCSRYEVVGEYEGDYKVNGHILNQKVYGTNTAVNQSKQLRYSVEVDGMNTKMFDDLNAARMYAFDTFKSLDPSEQEEVTVLDTYNGNVVVTLTNG